MGAGRRAALEVSITHVQERERQVATALRRYRNQRANVQETPLMTGVAGYVELVQGETLTEEMGERISPGYGITTANDERYSCGVALPELNGTAAGELELAITQHRRRIECSSPMLCDKDNATARHHALLGNSYALKRVFSVPLLC